MFPVKLDAAALAERIIGAFPVGQPIVRVIVAIVPPLVGLKPVVMLMTPSSSVPATVHTDGGVVPEPLPQTMEDVPVPVPLPKQEVSAGTHLEMAAFQQ